MRHSIIPRNISTLAFAVGVMAAAGLASSQVMAQSVPQQGDEVWEYLASMPNDERRAVLEREAEREGSFVLYGQMGIDRAEHIQRVFNERYPNITLNFVRQTAAEQSEKVLLEHRLNRMGGDVLMTDTSLLYVLQETIAPFEPSAVADFDPRFVFGGKDEGWYAVAYELLPSAIVWRTDRVPEGEAPKTLEALADPKWKGQVGTTTHLESFIEAMNGVYGEEEASKRVRDLARLDNQLFRSQAALAEAVSAGTVDIAWNISTMRADQMKSRGEPVDWVLQDPLFGISVVVTPLKQAPHPYAAALFTEFLLEAETIEKLEVAEGLSRMFGNLKGSFQFNVEDHPSLQPYPPVSEENFRRHNQMAEQLFIRKDY